MRVDRQPAGVDEGFAPRQAQEQPVAEHRHDWRFGCLAAQVVEPDGADKLAFHEDAETITVWDFVEMIGKLLLDDGIKQAVRMERLVAQPGDRFEILALSQRRYSTRSRRSSTLRANSEGG
ncbi:hypothetical protein AJ88_32485 [Mesorhizobium amorphae CCBAU 01583]|nr:hypothetical protein AJ88_32485 [Mesorhizobium amorphae CCBAU 01583]